MTDTTIPDAVVFPQDSGTGVANGNEDYTSAAGFQLLSKYKGSGSYVGEDVTGSPTLQFNDVDTSNEQVDVGTGYAYINESSHTIQSGAQTIYDTILPVDSPYVVILPNEITNLGLGTDTSNDVWLAVDPSNNDDVFIRHGSGLSAPSDPSVKLGTVNSSTGDTTRLNDLASIDTQSVNTDELATTQSPSNTKYWPYTPVLNQEINSGSPPQSFTRKELSSLPSDANYALIDMVANGDGSSNNYVVQVREADSSRDFDARLHGDASKTYQAGSNSDIVPVNSNQEIQWRETSGTASNVVLWVTGYF